MIIRHRARGVRQCSQTSMARMLVNPARFARRAGISGRHAAAAACARAGPHGRPIGHRHAGGSGAIMMALTAIQALEHGGGPGRGGNTWQDDDTAPAATFAEGRAPLEGPRITNLNGTWTARWNPARSCAHWGRTTVCTTLRLKCSLSIGIHEPSSCSPGPETSLETAQPDARRSVHDAARRDWP